MGKRIALFFVSFFVVSLGQPAFIPWLGLLAASIGYALFFQILLDVSDVKKRFWLSTLWYTAIQWSQLSWFLSHPYLYILTVHFALSFLWGLQFGILGALITKERIQKIVNVIALSCLWVLMEWSRLFLLAGFTWNPVGLALTGSVYPLQMASLAGVFGLTFWVLFVNFLALRRNFAAWGIAAIIPYIFGVFHLAYHTPKLEMSPQFSALLVQTAFPPEEAHPFKSFWEMREHVLGEWQQIFKILEPFQGKEIDLLVFPEGTVPFGTYSFVYTLEEIKGAFGADSLPPLELPLAYHSDGIWRVNNAFIAKAIANRFDTGVVIGLEDAENQQTFSSAQYFTSEETKRYDKQVLVPMGEYIPFTFCKKMAASYGICGSLTHGRGAKVMEHAKVPFGISICYEEMFGDLMRENRQKGAELLVNITNDAWYPNSRLPLQHFTHSVLRTVENGFSLLRSCNTGVTAGVDSLGRTVSQLEGEWTKDALLVKIPTYAYQTLYSKVGDGLIIGFSFISVLLFFKRTKKN